MSSLIVDQKDTHTNWYKI